MKSDFEIFQKELCYKLQGIFIKVSREFGCNFKEWIYHNACKNEFIRKKINFISKPQVNIFSDDGERVGKYFPDFVVENKIIIEIKSLKCLLESSVHQLIKYLEKSEYEIGYLVNFGISYAQIIRRIYTNDRKGWYKLIANKSRTTQINTNPHEY